MTALLEQYWPFALIALLLVVAVIGLLGPLRKRRERVAPPPLKAPPLQPVRPDIAPAAPAEFVTAAPAPATSSAPPVAMAGALTIAPAVGVPDNLMLLKGVGPKLNTVLKSLGILRFDQIAAWGAADIAEIDAHLGDFAGRIVRDNWVDQAGYLARGDTAGFEAKYGALGGTL